MLFKNQGSLFNYLLIQQSFPIVLSATQAQSLTQGTVLILPGLVRQRDLGSVEVCLRSGQIVLMSCSYGTGAAAVMLFPSISINKKTPISAASYLATPAVSSGREHHALHLPPSPGCRKSRGENRTEASSLSK